jgi:lycopene cyclase domain-containing protein
MAPYVALNVLVLLAVVLAVCNNGLRFSKALWLAMVVLLLATLLFDNLIIAAGIVGYDAAKISGIRLWLAPLEDFAYSIAAVLLAALLWKVSGKKR